jgi:hypothetical protein
MSRVAYFVALPFAMDDAGYLVAGQGEECQRPSAARMRAAGMVRMGAAGAVAFSRTGDPDMGEFEPAELLETFGLVSDDLTEL